jgi:hypothetical protein
MSLNIRIRNTVWYCYFTMTRIEYVYLSFILLYSKYDNDKCLLTCARLQKLLYCNCISRTQGLETIVVQYLSPKILHPSSTVWSDWRKCLAWTWQRYFVTCCDGELQLASIIHNMI